MPAVETIHEQDRLNALARYDILDTPEEESFDRITRLVCRILKVPMSTVTFLDGHRQWFKSRQGVTDCEGERGVALCNVAIRQSEPLIVADTLADPRFMANPLVTGAPQLRFYAGIPLRSAEGQNIGTLCAMDIRPRELGADELLTLTDLAQLVMSELELRLLASVDGLTGALSRRAFREETVRALALAQRHRHEASCIVFDLDHFKAINDDHGHAAGDAVLAGSIAACRRLLRQSDLLGRVGGEEFALFLPHTGRAAALGVAEKLRQGIAELRFPAATGRFGVTASFGVATANRAAPDIDTLLRQADEALYAAKAAGRDRCLPWLPEEGGEPVNGRRVLKAGRIVFNGGHSVIDCTVKRLSDNGASIAAISTAGIPERFKLAIDADEFSKFCHVVGKADRQIEVQFA